jgi:hypothetical protein
LAQDLIGVTLPSQVLEQVKAEKQISALATKVGIQLFDYNRGNSQFMGTTLYHMQARERLQDKAIYLQSFFDWLIHPDQWNWSNTSDN